MEALHLFLAGGGDDHCPLVVWCALGDAALCILRGYNWLAGVKTRRNSRRLHEYSRRKETACGLLPDATVILGLVLRSDIDLFTRGNSLRQA